MNNVLICSNCKTENPLYSLNCKTCNSFLRSKISNIDLWDAVWNILVSPIDVAVKIIQAEKKNFVGFLLVVWLLKSAVNNYILMNYASVDHDLFVSFSKSLLEGGIFSILILFGFSFITSSVLSLLKIPVRFKDNLAIYSYALTPVLLGFVFLTPFHFALYGFYWYTVNPSPFIIKPLVTYVLYGIEGLLMVWTLVLFVAVTYAQSKKTIYSIIMSIILFISLYFYHIIFIINSNPVR